MDRRQFIGSLALAAAWRHRAWAASPAPEIAFTFDDPETEGGANLTWQEINERMLTALREHRLKAVLFVTGKRVDSDAGQKLVAAWDREGHLIGNHSYSHFSFNQPEMTVAGFEADMLRNESLIKSRRHFVRLFRFPYFKEGDTAEKRDGMRAFLKAHGYRIGRATIDASDWAIDHRLNKRATADPHADLSGYRNFFLEHIWQRAQFYQSLAARLLPQPVRHTVLLHHTALNALFLGDLIAMFQEKGWKPVDAAYAYRDPVYERQPKILPAGEGLIWALAKESGKFESELRYPGEDDVYENPRMDALHL